MTDEVNPGHRFRLLFVGDIVGPAAVAYLADRLPSLRRSLAIDLVVANAENASLSGRSVERGFGMSGAAVATLFAAGVDAITSGNHAWDQPDCETVLAHPRVLRPHNLPPGRCGDGVLTIEVGGGPVSILNLADADAIPDASPPYPAWQAADLAGAVVVDFHGGRMEEKVGFAHAVDGRVAAVLGTHTHEPTLPLHLLPGGTALVVDVGMTGPTGGWGGIDPAQAIATVRGEPRPETTTVAAGPIALGAVALTIEAGRTVAIERVL